MSRLRDSREGIAPVAIVVLVVLASVGLVWGLWSLYTFSVFVLVGILLIAGMVALRWFGFTNAYFFLAAGVAAIILIAYGLATSGVIH